MDSPLMEVYMLGIGKPNSANSEEKKDWDNSSRTVFGNDPPPPPHQGMRNWGGMPQLIGLNSPNTNQSRWREEDLGICNMRVYIRSQIVQFLLSRMRNKSNFTRAMFRNLCNQVETKLFREASTKAEYVNGATLKHRIIDAVSSLKSQKSQISSRNPGVSSNQVIQGEKRRRSMEIISNQTKMTPLQNYWCSQQNYLLDQQRFPVQEVVVSPTNNMSGLLVDDRLEGSVRMYTNSSQNCDEFVNPQFQNYQHNIQSPTLSKFNCNGGDAVSCRNYVDGLAKSSMNGFGLFWCQHQELEHNRIVQNNFEAHQVTAQHNAWKADAPFTFDAGTSAMPRKATCQTTDGGISPAPEFSFKRRKIDNLPLSINRTDHALHPRRIDTFSGYVVTPEWKPFPLHDSPQGSLQKHQQWMSYAPSITKVDMNKLFDSALSREPVHSNKQEPILCNILYKGKAEEEKSLHSQKDHFAGEEFWSKDLCPKYVIKEPDRHIETPIGQAEISDVDKSLGSDQSKIRGASLTETFTPHQLEVHLARIREWIGETKPKIDEKLAMGEWKNDDACQLCAVEKLFFAPGCFLCGKVFKKMDTYHSATKFGMECRVCNKCSKRSEGEKLSVSGLHINQDKLSLDTDQRYQETFVQCDRCNGWQHHTCALFNNEMNIGDKAEYICPKCSIKEIRNGRVPLDQSFIPGATDLPTTELSDFIEDRLFSCLKKERDARAESVGKNSDEVLGAEDLVVRVVLSVEKKLLVKQEFLDVFKEENYPKELPYRSKFILLFQKIDGVDVCLFGMYVQEYGSKCAHPNQRSIYISYLDSVKYFRPDGVITATGESLRTLVYQQILVGYLDYCRKRGFSRCYIWSCPPSKADNYIFNCHPEIQKNPKLGTLRDWYGEMLRKAAKENIVASVSNLYDYFFAPHGEQKVTAARLPYFDGDYWPLIAEDLLKKRVKDKPTPIRKARKQKPSFEAVECTDTSGDSPMGDQLMQDLGKEIRKKKENFIVVDLETQHMAEEDTDQDEDKVIEGRIFDGRYNFLDFCMQHHYQFDNLQRAKHSSMMILYYLHNPSAYIQKRTCPNGVNPQIIQQEIRPQGKGKGSKSRLFNHMKL
ncbi:hypothetical protein C5167_012283 [Papaver somniferum]|uniref:histone acetyltransferase n=1 Tax=Papaver somniferum TaxID=3469 RepID=A0A4Y7J0Y7_PAPSO|nr:probable histone acetyltransferase HAC-like 1 [Papaver somniferum]RZC53418.1 hypothetical protein C5167_012283 [Papaver somniferum]